MNLKKIYVSLALAATLLTFAPKSSWALPMVTVDGTTATGILNLDVDGTLYNVTFPKITGEDFYGPAGNAVFQFTTFESGGDAVTAVVNALNLYNSINDPDLESVGDSSGAISGPVFWVGVGDDNGDLPTSFCAPPVDNPCIQAINGAWKGTTKEWFNPSGAEFLAFDDITNYADFQVVPEPGTALLIGLGLAGLSAAGRSRQGEGQGTA
jgi:hypothetical protein